MNNVDIYNIYLVQDIEYIYVSKGVGVIVIQSVVSGSIVLCGLLSMCTNHVWNVTSGRRHLTLEYFSWKLEKYLS